MPWLEGTRETARSGELPTTTSLIDAFYLSGTPTTATGQTWVPLSAATGSGSLTLSGIWLVVSTGSGSLTLSGAVTVSVVGVGTASLTLSGVGVHSSSGSGSLSLSGSGAPEASGSASGSLSLAASGSSSSAAAGSASLSLSGAANLSGSFPVDGTGSLSLDGSGATSTSAAATGSLSFSGSGAAVTAASSTASLSLSGSGAAVSRGVGSASLSLSGSGSATLGASGTATLSFSGTGAGSISRSGTGSLSLVMQTITIVAGVVAVQGRGRVSIPEETLTFPAEMGLVILDPTMLRAPSSITVVLTGAVAQTDVTFSIDGLDVYTTSTDSDGELGPTSLNVTATMGTLGTHTVMATQGSVSDSATFVILRAPANYPNVAGVDAPPVGVPGALTTENGIEVRHWVFQDLLAEVEGGIGSYVFPHNPRNMTSPHLEHAMSSVHSTASDGKIHVFQAGKLPKEWQFTGFCPSQAHQEAILTYRNLNRRFWIIDHRNRAWKAVITNAEFVPRLRQNYNGQLTDWGSDFTVSATVLDQNYVVPV